MPAYENRIDDPRIDILVNRVTGFFMGQIMEATQGQANPKVANQLLSKKVT